MRDVWLKKLYMKNKMDEQITREKLKEQKNKQLSDKFRIQAEKNEYKIEALSNMLDKEEARRHDNV